MKFLKKQGLGTWLSLVAIIVAVAAFVIYNQVIVAGDQLYVASGSEFFYDSYAAAYGEMVSAVNNFFMIGVALLAVALVIGQGQQAKGVFGKVCDFVAGVARILAPAVLLVTFLSFLNGSFTGLGWTFFSNEELEIYAEAIEVGNMTILALGLFAVSAVLTLFGSFFPVAKKIKK